MRLGRLLDWPARRLTAGGRIVLVGTAFAAGFGVDTTLSAAHQAFALGAALLLVTIAATWRRRVSVRVARRGAQVASVGEPYRYEIEIENRGAKPIFDLAIRDDLEPDRVLRAPPIGRVSGRFGALRARLRQDFAATRRWQRGGSIDDATLPVLAPGESRRVSLEFVPLRRGVVRFARAALLVPEPLGLARAVHATDSPGRIVVLPERHPVPRLALGGAQQLQQGGVANAGKIGDVADFVGLRDYRPGDSPKRMSWKSFARVGRPIVREHEEEHFVRQALVLDTFCGDDRGAVLDAAASVAASLAVTIDTTEALLDLLLVEDRAFRLTAGRGLGDLAGLLEAIAVVRPAPAAGFATLAAHVLEHADAASGMVLVLLAWDAPRRALVEALERRGDDLRVVVVCEPEAPALDLGATRVPVRTIRTDRVALDLASLS